METKLLLAIDKRVKNDVPPKSDDGPCNSPLIDKRITDSSNIHTAMSASLENLNDTSHSEHCQLLCKSLENIDNNSQINQRLLNEKKCLSRSSSFVCEMKDVTIGICSKPPSSSPKNSSPNTRIFSTNRFEMNFYINFFF